MPFLLLSARLCAASSESVTGYMRGTTTGTTPRQLKPKSSKKEEGGSGSQTKSSKKSSKKENKGGGGTTPDATASAANAAPATPAPAAAAAAAAATAPPGDRPTNPSALATESGTTSGCKELCRGKTGDPVKNKKALRIAIEEYLDDPSKPARYGSDINCWDVSRVANMKIVFAGLASFNEPVNCWNTSRVTNMQHMFLNAASFNQPIGGWDTSNVTNMHGTFMNASSFNQYIGNWSLSKVEDMSRMFSGAASFNQDLCPFNRFVNLGRVNGTAMFEGTDCPYIYISDDFWCSSCRKSEAIESGMQQQDSQELDDCFQWNEKYQAALLGSSGAQEWLDSHNCY